MTAQKICISLGITLLLKRDPPTFVVPIAGYLRFKAFDSYNSGLMTWRPRLCAGIMVFSVIYPDFDSKKMAAQTDLH